MYGNTKRKITRKLLLMPGLKLAGVPAISCKQRPKIFRGGCKGIKARFSRVLLNNASSPKKIIAIILETIARELRHYSPATWQCKGK